MYVGPDRKAAYALGFVVGVGQILSVACGVARDPEAVPNPIPNRIIYNGVIPNICKEVPPDSSLMLTCVNADGYLGSQRLVPEDPTSPTFRDFAKQQRFDYSVKQARVSLACVTASSGLPTKFLPVENGAELAEIPLKKGTLVRLGLYVEEIYRGKIAQWLITISNSGSLVFNHFATTVYRSPDNHNLDHADYSMRVLPRGENSCRPQTFLGRLRQLLPFIS